MSFKYYEKSLRSFASRVLKGFMYGALIGGVLSYPYNREHPHIAFAGSLFFGIFFGVPGGAVYGIVFPRLSDEIILEKKGWYISK